MPSSTIIHEHVFNDDLLINEALDSGKTDLEWAREQFPEIIHLLDYHRLREKFSAYDKEANRTRGWVRCLGFAAVISATLALLALATEPVWPHANWTPWLALALETGGLIGTLVAVAGISNIKSRWLHARLLAERMRQWHFQLLLRRGSQVEASLQPGGQDAFRKQRDIWFDDFLRAYEGNQDGKLSALTGPNAQGETWLHETGAGYGRNSIAFPHICRAFKRLRFDHQVGYAHHKLRPERIEPVLAFTEWPVIHQLKVLSASAGFCFVCASICSVILICSYAAGVLGDNQHQGLSLLVQNCVRTAAIAIAIIGAALRTVEGGFAPEKEMERYEDYRSRTTQLRDRFVAATDLKERLYLMEELELATVDEMKSFLRTHHNATFVMA
jgi:hypothetical protein